MRLVAGNLLNLNSFLADTDADILDAGGTARALAVGDVVAIAR